ncbi:MAG: hypothetical protein ACYC5N_00940 [Endomicrobiales bacterium]
MLFSSTAFAERFKTSLWGAFGVVSMTELSLLTTDGFGNLSSKYTLKGATIDDIISSAACGFDAGYEFFPGLVFGGRIAALKNSLNMDSGTVVLPVTGGTGRYRIKMETSITPLMVGGSFTQPLGGRFSIAGLLYIGYALSSADITFRASSPDVRNLLFPFSGSDEILSFSGSGIASDVSGEVRYHFSDHVSVGAAAHLIMVQISELKSGQGAPYGYATDGSSANSVLSFEYNNFSLGLSLNFAF